MARDASQPTPPHTPPPTSRNGQYPAWRGSGRSPPSSPSEFEFSMSILGSPTSSTVTHMRSADLLFHDGKLLPLYDTMSLAPASSRPRNAEQLIPAIHPIHAEPVADRGSTCSQQHSLSHGPFSPNSPTCRSRWKELLRLRKTQNQDGKDGLTHCNRGPARLGHSSCQASEQLVPAGGSTDARGVEIESGKLRSSEIESQEQVVHAPCCLLHEPGSGTADCASCPFIIQQSRQSADMAVPLPRRSEDLVQPQGLRLGTDTQHVSGCADGLVVTARHIHSASGTRARSPSKQQVEQCSNGYLPVNTSPRRGGSRGVGPGRPSVGSRPMESSRNAMAPRLVVRGLDRSYSTPRPMRRQPEHLRSVVGRQRAGEGGGSGSNNNTALERSISYSAGVRVSPVINVPLYISPTFRKGSKSGIFNFFSSKKEKTPSSTNSKKLLTPSPV